MKIALYLLFVICLISCSSKFERDEHFVDKTENESFDKFKRKFIDTLCLYDPLWASQLGFHYCDSFMFIPNPDNRKKKLDFAQQVLDTLAGFNFQVLSRDNQREFYDIEDLAKKILFNISQLKAWEWNPSLYSLHDDFYSILNTSDVDLEKRLTSIFKKLNQVPEYYTQAKMNILHPTKEHTIYAIDTVKSSFDIFENAILDSLKKIDHPKFKMDSFKRKLDLAAHAVKYYLGWLENDLLPNMDTSNTRDFRLGKANYSRKFDLETQSIYKADEIYAKAMEEKAKMTEEMFQLSDTLWPKYFGILKKPEDEKLKMIKMLLDTVSIVYDTLRKYEKNEFNSIPAIVEFAEDNDLIPEDYFVEDSVDNYAENRNHSIQEILKFIDGQTSLFYKGTRFANRLGISDRRTNAEAWSLYLLQLMINEGFAINQPETRLMFYKHYIEILSATILAYNVHVYGMNKEEAIELLTHEAFLSKEKAEKCWKRIVLNPIDQDCNHFADLYEINRLKGEMKSRLGDDFELEDFHEYLLSFGNVPIKHIRLQLMDN